MMSTKKPQSYTKHHTDGSVWARGHLLNGKPEGYFVWYRKDGTKLRSGNFRRGQQIGKWTTYDQQGNAYKVTLFKTKN